MHAKQLSQRGGEIYCEQKNGRVIMGGNCVFYMKGEVSLHELRRITRIKNSNYTN